MSLETAIMRLKFLWPLVLGLSIVIIDNGQYLRAETVTLSASQRQQLRSPDAKIILPNYIPPGFRPARLKFSKKRGMDTQSSLKMPRIAVFWWKESKTPGAMMV
ncbi:MAG UNVERIFIED_CONTAM: hypothetical protein LVR29_01110 [Microcystis novacekii LVE1205-3]|jgi:hypothetical protein